MQDRTVRSLVVVGLVLGIAVLALLLLGWFGMAVMMAGGGMMGGNGGMMGGGMAGMGIVVGGIAVLVLAAIVLGLVWALRTPTR